MPILPRDVLDEDIEFKGPFQKAANAEPRASLDGISAVLYLLIVTTGILDSSTTKLANGFFAEQANHDEVEQDETGPGVLGAE